MVHFAFLKIGHLKHKNLISCTQIEKKIEIVSQNIYFKYLNNSFVNIFKINILLGLIRGPTFILNVI